MGGRSLCAVSLVVLFVVACAGGDKDESESSPGSAPSTPTGAQQHDGYVSVDVELVAESVPKGMVAGEGYTATMNVAVQGIPGTYLTHFDAAGKNPQTIQLDDGGKATFSYPVNNMGSPAPGKYLAYKNKLTDEQLLANASHSHKLPGAVASQRTMQHVRGLGGWAADDVGVGRRSDRLDRLAAPAVAAYLSSIVAATLSSRPRMSRP